MSFYDLPKVRIPKEVQPLKHMSWKVAKRRFYEKIEEKKALRLKLLKVEKDIEKYYKTYMAYNGKNINH